MAILLKLLRNFKIPKYKKLIPYIIYIIFITLVLSITFPAKSKSNGPEKQIVLEDENNIGQPSFENIEEAVVKQLNDAFYGADTNKDRFLTVQELAKYINYKIREHIDEAIKMNPGMFAQIDLSPRDGLISWEEYLKYFLKLHNIKENYMKKALYDSLDRKLRERISRDKALFMEAARTDALSLTLDEFFTFRHPESSTTNLLTLVDDILQNFDNDGDEVLTVEEFADGVPNDLESNGKKLILSQNAIERKEEFNKIIDRNKDKKADRGELLSYVDPRHPRYSLQEAGTLFVLADGNKDNRLTLSEILTRSSIFMSSKMIDTAKSFHEEF